MHVLHLPQLACRLKVIAAVVPALHYGSMNSRPSIIQTNVALAGMTTLQVGSHAEFCRHHDEAALVAAIVGLEQMTVQ